MYIYMLYSVKLTLSACG